MNRLLLTFLGLTASFLSPFLLSCGKDQNEESKAPPLSDTKSVEADTAAPDETKKKGPFEIKSGVIEYKTEDKAGLNISQRIYSFDNFGSLVKLEEVVEGETSFYLYNQETKKGLKLFAGKKKARKSYGVPGEIASFITKQSTAGGGFKKSSGTVLDRRCDVFENNAKTDAGEPLLKLWFHQGITLKEVNRIARRETHSEAVRFEEKPLDRSTFKLPDGVEAPDDIFKE